MSPRAKAILVLGAAIVAVAVFGSLTTERPAGAVPTPAAAQASTQSTVTVDTFELVWELAGSDLLLHIDTDLPDEGELSVSVRRTYFEKEAPDTAYSRDYFSEFEPVSAWRAPRRISLDPDAWKADLRAHQDEMAKLGEGFAFEVGSIGEVVSVRAVLHLNQDDPRFGEGNRYLSGSAVTTQGNRKLVEAEVEIAYPLDGPPPTGASSYVAHDGLKAGRRYQLSGEAPLMPELEPSDPLAALERVQQLPAGTTIRVTEVRDRNGTIWYEVETDRGAAGWINSTALIGMRIRATPQ